jgi:hypothetical protein
MLCDFYPINQSNVVYPKIPETILIIVFFSYFVEEVRKVITYDNKLIRKKIYSYLNEFLNGAQMLGIILFIVGIILRFIPDDDCYLAARILLSIDLIFWYLKILVCFTPIKNLGPKITMIGVMTMELLYFIPLIVISMFAFGVSTYALQYHNNIPSYSLLKAVFFPGYFVFAGEFYTLHDMREAPDSSCFQNFTSIMDFTENRDCIEPVGSQVGIAIYVIYLLYMYFLIVNLLIAIFG